jgi:protein gp37
MNEQKPPGGIEWTRIQQPDGTTLRGYTWNPLSGCLHACAWRMPDGTWVECYAKTTAEDGVAQAAYPGGFEVPTFHPDRLDEPRKRKAPSGIFLDSMGDLMGHWNSRDEVEQVLDVCRQAHWHTFFALTKHAPRLAQFTWPPNVWVGASLPPDHMWGHPMTRRQQDKMLHRTMQTLARVEVPVRWVSFEPLSWDCADIVQASPGAIGWAVVGAASAGRTYYPPAPAVLARLLAVLDGQGVPVFFKGNLRSLPQAAAAWREDFPVVGAQARLQT